MKTPVRRVLLVAGLLAAVLVAGGCGSTNTTGPGTTVTQDSADDLALQTVLAAQLIGADLGNSLSDVGPAPMARGRATPFAALWDTTFTQGGLTFSLRREFYDVQDGLLPGYGPAAVRLHTESRIRGSVEMPRDTASVGHHALLDVRGIQAEMDTLRIDGAALDTLQNRFRSFDGTRTRYMHWRSTLTANAVRILKSQMDGGYPLSGRLTYVVQADRLRSSDLGDVEVHLSAVVVITFNGTNQSDVTVNSRYHYRWNMSTGTLVRA